MPDLIYIKHAELVCNLIFGVTKVFNQF